MKKLIGIFKKLLITLLLLATVFFIALPPFLYSCSLNQLNSKPEKPHKVLSDSEVERLWVEQKECSPKACSNITPYWVYRWLGVAIINDYITQQDLSLVTKNYSMMAGKIALFHMRKKPEKFKSRGMLQWHLTSVFLTVWISRNWTPNEIASKYNEITTQ